MGGALLWVHGIKLGHIDLNSDKNSQKNPPTDLQFFCEIKLELT